MRTDEPTAAHLRSRAWPSTFRCVRVMFIINAPQRGRLRMTAARTYMFVPGPQSLASSDRLEGPARTECRNSIGMIRGDHSAKAPRPISFRHRATDGVALNPPSASVFSDAPTVKTFSPFQGADRSSSICPSASWSTPLLPRQTTRSVLMQNKYSSARKQNCRSPRDRPPNPTS